MDELGLGIEHSDDANIIMFPFYYASRKISYSLMIPIKSIQGGENATRDYVFGV